jgi:hypothetical protein
MNFTMTLLVAASVGLTTFALAVLQAQRLAARTAAARSRRR